MVHVILIRFGKKIDLFKIYGLKLDLLHIKYTCLFAVINKSITNIFYVLND